MTYVSSFMLLLISRLGCELSFLSWLISRIGPRVCLGHCLRTQFKHEWGLNILVIKATDFCLQIGKVTDCAFSSSATICRVAR